MNEIESTERLKGANTITTLIIAHMRRVFCWRSFYALLRREMQMFLFLWCLLCAFRAAFLSWMWEYTGPQTNFMDVGTALFYGLRLSMKSAGALTLASFITSLCVHCIVPRHVYNVQKWIGRLYIFLLSVLFFARIPYYEQFHSGFNQLIFNTFKDDAYALFISLVKQFHLPGRLALAVLTAWLLCRLYDWWSRRFTVREIFIFSRWQWKLCFRLALLFFLYQCCLWIRFGGAASYVGDIDWENAGVTKDRLLNEAILDDVQALYRAYELNGRVESSTGLMFEPAQVAQYGEFLAQQKIGSANLDDYLRKAALGHTLEPPRQIFLIVSESYANWPLMDQYAELHIADGMKELVRLPDSDYVGAMLPNGMSTVSGVMGILTGFADANLYLTHLPEAYHGVYPTALAAQVKKLGYFTNFWYAGPNSWERIQDFSLAQGFDVFHGRGDYGKTEGNVWGCDDAQLYQAVLNGVSGEQPGFHLILNTSNHSPFTVDLAKEGFEREQVRRALPERERENEELLTQLGHFWYADRQLAAFVQAAKKKYPESLFLIVGDHADRLNLDKNPSLYERYAVPLIVMGHGIDKHTFPDRAAGSHIDVIPTLLELIAPEGFVYYSLGTSLTRGNTVGVNYGFWITPEYIGYTDSQAEPERFRLTEFFAPDLALIHRKVDAIRCISWWRSKYGNRLPESS